MDLDQVKEKLYSLKKEACFLVDNNKNIVDVEPNIELILGYKKEEMIGKCYEDIIYIYGYYNDLDGVINLKNKKGEEVFTKIDYDKVKIGGEDFIVGTIRDVSESIKLEEELRYLTYHDVVTGLYNRNYYEDILKKLNKLKNEKVGVILCDLDELKYVNDNFGHHRGDELIETFGKFLNDFCNENRIAFRIGGDEILIMEIGGTEESLEDLIKEIKLNIKKINTKRKNILLKFSLGSAYTTNSFNNMNTLMKLADLRMYRNKNTKKSMRS